MALFKLNKTWSDLMRAYREEHQHPVNKACHRVGIPLINLSVPVGMTIVGLPLGVTMWTVGWGFQFVGHAFEGNKPSFTQDKRQLVIGVLWWTREVGLPLVEIDTDVAQTSVARA